MNDPEHIACSDLVKAGYPENYGALQRALEGVGWRYNINCDHWDKPRRPRMTATIADPQHGYQRDVTQGDVDNLIQQVATLTQQITDMKNAQALAASLAAQPPTTSGAASSSRGGPAKEA